MKILILIIAVLLILAINKVWVLFKTDEANRKTQEDENKNH